MIGTKLAHYEVVRHLGTGGMGEVYEAVDSKLSRSVAIKLLPAPFLEDKERIQRFQREARSLAQLNHPSIASIYGFEETERWKYLVMELAQGDTLATRIARGRIPWEEATLIAKQIAEALEAAHEKGILHRDLKPANIKVSAAGQVKVLDFGLATAFAANPGNSNLSDSPTMTMMSISTPGTILGTAAYMSPEQVKGKDLNRSSDLWAFGCVLFEMLTGRRAFDGETTPEILSAVLKSEPDWSRLPDDTPETIRRLLGLCLRKEARLRLRDAGDAILELEETPQAAATRPGSQTGSRLVWAAALAVVTVTALIEGYWLWSRDPASSPAREMRLEVSTAPTSDPLSLAISPDAEKLVFAAGFQGRPHLWLRRLDSTEARPLPGTEYPLLPFWSPDSNSVGFFSGGRMKRIDLDSESVRDITRAVVPGGATWNREGVILFPIVPDGHLFRVSATGGLSRPVTELEPLQLGHRFPHFLPDDRHFLFFAPAPAQKGGIYLGDLGGGKPQRLVDADTPGVLTATGHLLFVRDGTLLAQYLDQAAGTLRGSPSPVATNLISGGAAGAVALSASAAGPIAFRTGSWQGKRQYVWFNRKGDPIERIDSPESAIGGSASLSLHSNRLAYSRTTQGNTDIWLLNLGRPGTLRFTTAPGPDIAPLWSLSGDSVVYSAIGRTVFDLHQKLITGETPEVLWESSEPKQATDLSADGRTLLFRSNGSMTDWDIWGLSLEGQRKAFPIVQTEFEERDAKFSPDGKWIAYVSNAAGRFDVYVQSYPMAGAKTVISANGGSHVRWSRESNELFYLARDGTLMTVPFSISSNGQMFDARPPRALFVAPVSAVQDLSTGHYSVTPDGQRFLVDTAIEEAANPITVVLDWKIPAEK